MKTPYGPCGHTHYDSSPPCVHTAYLHGFEDGQDSVIAEITRKATDRILAAEQAS